MSEPVYFILGFKSRPTGPHYPEPGGEWFYFKTAGKVLYKKKWHVHATTSKIADACRFPTVEFAFASAANLWGGPWEVIVEPLHEIIERKTFYGQKS